MSISAIVTAYYWLFLVGILGVIGWAVLGALVPSHGQYSDIALIKDWLAHLLRRGYERGYLRLVHKQSGQFLQFRKYIRGKGDYGIEVECLGLDWTEGTWDKAKRTVQHSGLPHRIEPLRTKTGSREGLIIDCHQDTAAAYEIGRAIWREVFGLTLETRYDAIRGGWSEVDELIDGPDHPPPLESIPKSQRIKEFDARLRKAGQLSVGSMLLSAINVIALLVSGIGFSIAMLISRGRTPGWSLQIGATSLGGTTSSLIFLIILVLSIIGFLALPRATKIRQRTRWERRQRLIVRAFLAFLPIALFFAWTGH